MSDKTKDFRKNIADKFITLLTEKELSWKKEWQGPSMLPRNAVSNKDYKGINKFYLSMVAMDRGFEDPRWCTFNQIKDKGWKLNKGAKGHKVEYWMPYDIEARMVISWEEFAKRNTQGDNSVILSSKYYTVFNAEEITGMPEIPKLETHDVNIDEILDEMAKNMGVKILHDGGNRAFYRPSTDDIHLPEAKYFKNDYAYNSTKAHELAHSTGAAHRLNRDLINRFGTPEYAYEELVAEITSCFISSSLNIEQGEEHIENHKAYVQSWIKQIKEKPETLFKAIKKAEEAATYMEEMANLNAGKEKEIAIA